MAETEKPVQTPDVASRPVQLHVPQDEAPVFANYVQSSTAVISSSGSGDNAIWTLMFVHVYPNPTSPENAEIRGNVVARVSMNRETVEELAQLLANQLKQSTPRRSRARRGEPPKNGSS
jgi:hypothetical protein